MDTQRSILRPENREEWLKLRTNDITSTEISALFNCSPYTTRFELWHRKHDKTVVELEPNDRLRWGTRLQDSIAAGIAEDNGWKIRKMDEYIRMDGERLGASFDFAIEEIDGAKVNGLLEIKNVDALIFRDGWILDGDNMEAPPHIELQAQQQLLVSNADFNYIGALVGGNRVVLMKREPDLSIQKAILKANDDFWKSIKEGEMPEPDFERDAEFIIAMNSHAEPGKVIDVKDTPAILSLVELYLMLSAKMKEAKEKKDALKAEILTHIGDAEKVLGSTFTISAGMIGPAFIEAHERSGYRNFKVIKKKEKK